MKYCQRHWTQLRLAIDAAGLGGFVSKSDVEAARRTKAEMEGDPAVRPDPLMMAHNMVVARALEFFGVSLMHGDPCPVCKMLTLPDPPTRPGGARTREQLEAHYSTELAEAVGLEFRAHPAAPPGTSA